MAQVHLFFPAEETVEHAPGHIAHVADALAQILVVHLRERAGVALGHRVEGVLGVDLLRLNDAHGLVNERRVFQHHQVRVKNAGLLGADACRELVLHRQDLFARVDEGLFQTVDFFGQLGIGQFAPRNRVSHLVQHEDLAAANAGRNRYAPEGLLAFVQPLGHARGLTNWCARGKKILRAPQSILLVLVLGESGLIRGRDENDNVGPLGGREKSLV